MPNTNTNKNRTKNRLSFCLSSLCLILANGVALAQYTPPKTPSTPIVPGLSGGQNPHPALTAPVPPKPARVFYFTLIPFETMEPSVQFTPEQSVKIKAIYDKYDADIAALRLTSHTPQEKTAATEKMRQMQLTADNAINDAMTAEQRPKAQGLMYELARMISMGMSPQMLHDLKLTPAQRVEILKIEGVVLQKSKALSKEEKHTKYQALMEVERAKIPALLTPAQLIVFDRYDATGHLKGTVKPAAAPSIVVPKPGAVSAPQPIPAPKP